ncbi:hypothetical protein AB0L06_29585 [Spirillospora sp. NPDC052269]
MSDPPGNLGLGGSVYYRDTGEGQTLRAAIITAKLATLDPAAVEAGTVPALDDDQHVHLSVFTPLGVAEAVPNVPPAPPGRPIEPGTWAWPPRT